MARRARLTDGQEVTVDDAGADALERSDKFLTWADVPTTNVPRADGTFLRVPSTDVKAALAQPGMAPVVDAMGDADPRKHTPIKQTDGTTMWVPHADTPQALRSPNSAGGNALRALADTFSGAHATGEAASRADLPSAAAGAWNPSPDWAKGGAALRTAASSPRETALEYLAQPSVISANPETGEFTQMSGANAATLAEREGQQRIRITPEEMRATVATQEGLAADEAEADRRRQAALDVVSRTKVPAPRPSTGHPGVSVQQVGTEGTARTPIDLAALAPAGSIERGLAGVGSPATPARDANQTASRTPLADQLAALQSQAALSRMGTGISRAGARINEALTGAKADSGFWNGMDEESARGIQDYVQRQSLAQQEGDRARKLGEEAALKDPFSAESKRFQAALAKTLPGVYSSEEIASMTAADAPFVTDFAKMKSALDARKQDATLAEQRRTDALAEADKQRTFQTEQARLNRAVDYAQINAAKARASAGGDSKEQQRAFKNEESLRKELMGNAATKDFQDVAVAFDKVQRAAKDPSAAGDLSLIFGYMKMLDPGSTVREGEFANAENAKGVPDALRARWNKFLSGERLTPDQRADFLNSARGSYDAQKASYDRVSNAYRDTAKAAGVNPERVALPLGLDLNNPPPVVDDNKAVAWARANASDPRAAAILQANGVSP